MMQQQDSLPMPPALPPPSTQQRRPRVREVSSRFMSGLTPSPSPSHSSADNMSLKSPRHQPQQRSNSVQRRRRLEMTDSSTDENNKPTNTTTPFIGSKPIKNQHQHRAATPVANTNGRPLTEMNAVKTSGKLGRTHGTPCNSRPDTPITSVGTLDRAVTIPSRFRRSTSAAGKLLQASGLTPSSQHESSATPQLRSSMPEASDMLPTVSGRLLAEKNSNSRSGNITTPPASPCSRSLNLPASSTLCRQQNSKVVGSLCLPPVHPAGAKVVADTRKGRNTSQQEDVHSLRLLHNRYLQWRFANAKAEASIQAQNNEAQKTLYSLAVKMSDLYDSVERKRIEHERLVKAKTLFAVLENQIPYLEEWSALEGNYSVSISEATQALLNACIHLPISGNVKANVNEIGESLSSAMKVMEMIACHVQNFLPKAENTSNTMSELAKVTGGEKSLIEECGDLLSGTYGSQVEECSLRSQLIQHERINTLYHKL